MPIKTTVTLAPLSHAQEKKISKRRNGIKWMWPLPLTYLVVDLIYNLVISLQLVQPHFEVWRRLDVRQNHWIHVHRFLVAVYRQNIGRGHFVPVNAWKEKWKVCLFRRMIICHVASSKRNLFVLPVLTSSVFRPTLHTGDLFWVVPKHGIPSIPGLWLAETNRWGNTWYPSCDGGGGLWPAGGWPGRGIWPQGAGVPQRQRWQHVHDPRRPSRLTAAGPTKRHSAWQIMLKMAKQDLFIYILHNCFGPPAFKVCVMPKQLISAKSAWRRVLKQWLYPVLSAVQNLFNPCWSKSLGSFLFSFWLMFCCVQKMCQPLQQQTKGKNVDKGEHLDRSRSIPRLHQSPSYLISHRS